MVSLGNSVGIGIGVQLVLGAVQPSFVSQASLDEVAGALRLEGDRPIRPRYTCIYIYDIYIYLYISYICTICLL